MGITLPRVHGAYLTGRYGRLSLRARSIFSWAWIAWILKCSWTLFFPCGVDASCTRWKQLSKVQVQRSPGPCGFAGGRSYFTTLSSRYFRGKNAGHEAASEYFFDGGFVKSSSSSAVRIVVIGESSKDAYSSSFSSASISWACWGTATSLRRPTAFLEYLPALGCRIDLRWRVTILGLSLLSSSSDEGRSKSGSGVGVPVSSSSRFSTTSDLHVFFLSGSVGSGESDFLFCGLSLSKIVDLVAVFLPNTRASISAYSPYRKIRAVPRSSKVAWLTGKFKLKYVSSGVCAQSRPSWPSSIEVIRKPRCSWKASRTSSRSMRRIDFPDTRYCLPLSMNQLAWRTTPLHPWKPERCTVSNLSCSYLGASLPYWSLGASLPLFSPYLQACKKSMRPRSSEGIYPWTSLLHFVSRTTPPCLWVAIKKSAFHVRRCPSRLGICLLIEIPRDSHTECPRTWAQVQKRGFRFRSYVRRPESVGTILILCKGIARNVVELNVFLLVSFVSYYRRVKIRCGNCNLMTHLGEAAHCQASLIAPRLWRDAVCELTGDWLAPQSFERWHWYFWYWMLATHLKS